MGTLKAGFARVDITPPVGVGLVGYYRVRTSTGILDPLLATAVAVSDGETEETIELSETAFVKLYDDGDLFGGL